MIGRRDLTGDARAATDLLARKVHRRIRSGASVPAAARWVHHPARHRRYGSLAVLAVLTVLTGPELSAPAEEVTI